MSVTWVNWKPARTGYASIVCSIVVDDDLSEIEVARLSKLVEEVTGKAPLSKYGLEVECEIVPLAGAFANVIAEEPERRMAVYTRGRTWHAAFTLSASEIHDWLCESGTQAIVPIISALHVEQTLEESL